MLLYRLDVWVLYSTVSFFVPIFNNYSKLNNKRMPITNNPQKVAVKIEVKTREILADEFGVSIKVLNAHIEKHHIDIPP